MVEAADTTGSESESPRRRADGNRGPCAVSAPGSRPNLLATGTAHEEYGDARTVTQGDAMHGKMRLPAAIAVVVLLAGSASADSGDPRDSPPPMSSDFRVSGSDPASDYDPAVANNPADGLYLVVWADTRDITTRGTDIYGRQVGSSQPTSPVFRISGSRADEYDPAVAHNSADDEYLVVWRDSRNTATRGTDIYGRRVAADGTRIGSDFRISGSTSGEYDPAVAYNSLDNEYLVVWADTRNLATRGTDIYGRRVKADGTRPWRDFRVTGAAATSDEYSPEVAFRPYANVSGEYLVVWEDYRDGDAEIFGQRLGTAGNRMGSDFRISQSTANEYSPALAYRPHGVGEYLVVWTRDTAARGKDIWGRRIRADGTRPWRQFRISGPGATSDEYEPAVAYNPAAYQYLVVWADGRSAARGTDIWGREVGAEGSLMSLDFRITGPAGRSDEYQPAIAYGPDSNRYLVVWRDGRFTGGAAARGTEIRGRLVYGP